MIDIKRYSSEFKDLWNEFQLNAKNASFLFNRNFLEYHADRFEDFSLLIFYKGNLVVTIPANIKDNTLMSHQGLTYGGIVMNDSLRLQELTTILRELLLFLSDKGIKSFILKPIPRMYHLRPADELDWALFILNAKLIRRDTALAIDNKSQRLPYQNRRTRSITKAKKSKLEIKTGYSELEIFWNQILIPNLAEKHGVSPVHSLDEIQKLAVCFPENILQHNIYMDDKPVAGTTMFINKKVAHAQYISGTDHGRHSGALDFLFDQLINITYSSFDYFDFGICNEDNGLVINKGLLDWKEGFGARTIVHDFYEIDPSEYKLLDNSSLSI